MDSGWQPSLPYQDGDGKSSGWSGSETSHERAQRNDRNGVTSKRQADTLAYLGRVGDWGATWVEVGAVLSIHHGSASGVLSNLHHDGRIARLTETRDRCKVYVLPEHVRDRPTEPFGRGTKGVTS